MIKLHRAFSAGVSVWNCMLVVPVGYLGALTLIAATRRPSSLPAVAGVTRFALVVPAHNEEATISALLDSVCRLDYPAALVAVHVVADNCTDDTSGIVRRAGFEVHARTDARNPGKGPALNWLIIRLLDREESFDVVVFLDADTTVAPDFLAAIEPEFRAGARAVQGFYGVKDPCVSNAAALRYCALACRHHLRPLARNTIGGSCGLFGNGMAFTRDLVSDRRWSAHLVEDMEMQIELLVDGVIVYYQPMARLEAEMPNTLAASVSQNQRWELGRMQIIRRSLPRLVRQLFDPHQQHRIAKADAVLDMCVPPLSVLAGAIGASAGISTVLAAIHPTKRARRNAWTSGLLVVALAAHVLTALRLVGAPAKIYRELLQAPRMVVWKIALLARLVRRDDGAVSWRRTQRNAEQGT